MEIYPKGEIKPLKIPLEGREMHYINLNIELYPWNTIQSVISLSHGQAQVKAKSNQLGNGILQY